MPLTIKGDFLTTITTLHPYVRPRNVVNNQNCSKTQKCSNFWTTIVVKPRNVVSFQPEVYQQFVDTLLVETLLHFWLRILLHFWLKNYYISGFYYDSGSKVTTFLGFTTKKNLVQKLLRVWLYYTSGYLLRFWVYQACIM